MPNKWNVIFYFRFIQSPFNNKIVVIIIKYSILLY